MTLNRKRETGESRDNEQPFVIGADGVDMGWEIGGERSGPGQEKAATGKARLKKPNRDQMMMVVIDVEGLVPVDHPVRAIWELVGSLDLSGFVEEIKAVEGEAGRPPMQPRLLIWFLNFCEFLGGGFRRCILEVNVMTPTP